MAKIYMTALGRIPLEIETFKVCVHIVPRKIRNVLTAC